MRPLDAKNIESKWKIKLPLDYLQFLDRGLLDSHKGLIVSYYQWLKPDQIWKVVWPDYKEKHLVPFAMESSTTSLCWSAKFGPGWVFYSPVDYYAAKGYAATCAGALFRALLEDLVCTNVSIVENMTLEEYVNRSLSVVKKTESLWPKAWISLIYKILRRKPKIDESGQLSFISRRFARDHVRQLLGFPMLDKEIIQFAGAA